MSPLRIVAAAAVAALGLLPVGAAAQGDQPNVIPVELSEFKITPSEIVLDKGRRYVLHLTDSGKRDHDLTAKAFFRTVSMDPASASSVRYGEIDLTPGDVADVGFTPLTGGIYEIHCGHLFHASLGMKGHIVVRFSHSCGWQGHTTGSIEFIDRRHDNNRFYKWRRVVEPWVVGA